MFPDPRTLPCLITNVYVHFCQYILQYCFSCIFVRVVIFTWRIFMQHCKTMFILFMRCIQNYHFTQYFLTCSMMSSGFSQSIRVRYMILFFYFPIVPMRCSVIYFEVFVCCILQFHDDFLIVHSVPMRCSRIDF